MQLIATRTAQEYNEREGRHGAFREGRYRATPIEADEHLHHCWVCHDLNRVRAGVEDHAGKWSQSVYVRFKPSRRPARRLHRWAVLMSAGSPLIIAVHERL